MVAVCPFRRLVVQSVPTQVTDFFATEVHFRPQELTTPITWGSVKVTDHELTSRAAFTVMVAT